MNPTPVKQTHVAAAVIERRDAAGHVEFLLGRRAPGTFYPGYWEFPGGKVEPGETPYDALVRELSEELGIEVRAADPWLVKKHSYEHANVVLHFFRVTEWRGELHNHVHSALAWQRPGACNVSPMLPANGPILKALELPARYGITHASEIGVDAQLLALAGALEAGLRLVQVREAGLDAARRSAFAHAAVDLAHHYGARVLINGDLALAAASGADGVHLPARQLMQTTARPDFPWVGASCHSAEELARAEALQLDFVVFGPVSATATHPGQAGIGWAAFQATVAESGLPVFAIGGLGVADLDLAWKHRAQGIAAIRGAWGD